ncbi:MAG: CoA-binding protein [Thermoplasmata archaeon]|nr:CoA-binding protein [Thermoplasmata archaeon]
MAEFDHDLRDLLTRARTIAVVGLSDKPDRDSHQIAEYLQSQGYRIIPVNPKLANVLGATAYPSLSTIPPEVTIDIVDIFRRSEEVGPIVDEAVRRGVGAIWMQLGVRNAEAASIARTHRIPVYEDLCIRVQHRRLKIPPRAPAAGA